MAAWEMVIVGAAVLAALGFFALRARRAVLRKTACQGRRGSGCPNCGDDCC